MHDRPASRSAQPTRRSLLALAGAGPALAACADIARLPPPPLQMAAGEAPPILGIRDARFWADGDVAPWVREAQLAATRRRSALGAARLPPPADYLALSGGGDFGAFGAGLMVGWSAAGTRPQFEVVTGISAGALIAPFAFLGPAYDPQLRDVFTGISPADVLVLGRLLTAVLFGEAIADTSPLYRLISRY